MGTTSFQQKFIRKEIQDWKEEIEIFSEFAKIQLHAAYAALAFPHGLSSKWNYLL